jgi:hypothetical protein
VNAKARSWPLGLGALALLASGCDDAALDIGTDLVADGGAAVSFDAAADRTLAPSLTVAITGEQPDGCGGPCVDLTARASGGVAPYSYRWSPGTAADGGVAQVCPPAAATYTVTVTDSSGRGSGEISSGSSSATATVTVGAPSGCGDASSGSGPFMVYWASWQDVDGSSITGLISPPSGPIQVVYEGPLAGAQTTNGDDDFIPAATFTSATVPNAPPGPSMIEVAGANPATLTFSSNVTDPLVAIYSLGTGYANQASSLLVDASLRVLSSGPNAGGVGYWGDGGLTLVEGGVSGIDGNGVVELEGTFQAIQWTNPADIPFASFTGLTVGVRAGP